MSLSTKRYCTCLLSGILLFCTALAQPSSSDTSLAIPVREYHRYLSPEANLFRGNEYTEYSYQLKNGHPFFGPGDIQQGSVLYKGVLYNNVPLQFDLVQQTLVMVDAWGFHKIGLIGEEIDSFTIRDNIFIHLRDSLHAPLRPGFYQLLHQGQITLLKQENKTVRQQIDDMTVHQYVDYSVSYYLKKDGVWTTVNSQKALLRAFGANRPALKKFLHTTGLRFRNYKENLLLQVAAWYDNLNPAPANPASATSQNQHQ